MFRKYTVLTLENISIAYLCITILPQLSAPNYKQVREQFSKYQSRRPKPTSDRYSGNHSTY